MEHISVFDCLPVPSLPRKTRPSAGIFHLPSPNKHSKIVPMLPKFKGWKLIDRYIATQVLFGLLIVTLILLGIAWFSQIIRLLSYLVNNNLSMLTFLRMTSLLLPDLFVIVAPVALFTVILFVYSRLLADKELVIMKSAGLTPKQLARPALAVAFLIMAFAYYATLYLSPVYSVKYRTLAFEARHDLSALLIKEGEFNQLVQGVTIYVRSAANNILSDIFITDSRTKGSSRTIIAERGVVTTTRNNIILSLENGSIQEKSNDKYTFGRFDRYTADLGIIAASEVRRPRADELGFFELIYARELGYAQNDAIYSRYLVQLHRRLLSPLHNVIFALLALLAVLKAPLSNRTGGFGPTLAVVCMVAFQALFIAVHNMLSVHRFLWPLVYFVFALMILALFRLLYSEREFSFKNPFGRK